MTHLPIHNRMEQAELSGDPSRFPIAIRRTVNNSGVLPVDTTMGGTNAMIHKYGRARSYPLCQSLFCRV